jgi:hypothetical protein
LKIHRGLNWGIILLTAFSLVACAARKPVVDFGPFDSYAKAFLQNALEQGRTIEVQDLVMKFGATSSAQEQGYCIIQNDEPPTIVINETGWNSLSETSKTILIHHEMGHCVLGRSHYDASNGNRPASIMNTYALPSGFYTSFRTEYLRELFFP